MIFKRFIYYSIGLLLGSIIVFFIWKGKNVSFDYGMDARTLKSIRTKNLVFSNNASQSILNSNIDSTAINHLLLNGDVDFGKSNQRKKPCPEYSISGEFNKKSIELWVIRCDTTATIETISIKQIEFNK